MDRFGLDRAARTAKLTAAILDEVRTDAPVGVEREAATRLHLQAVDLHRRIRDWLHLMESLTPEPNPLPDGDGLNREERTI